MLPEIYKWKYSITFSSIWGKNILHIKSSKNTLKSDISSCLLLNIKIILIIKYIYIYKKKKKKRKKKNLYIHILIKLIILFLIKRIINLYYPLDIDTIFSIFSIKSHVGLNIANTLLESGGRRSLCPITLWEFEYLSITINDCVWLCSFLLITSFNTLSYILFFLKSSLVDFVKSSSINLNNN